MESLTEPSSGALCRPAVGTRWAGGLVRTAARTAAAGSQEAELVIRGCSDAAWPVPSCAEAATPKGGGPSFTASSGIAAVGAGWLIAQDDATFAAWLDGGSVTPARVLPPASRRLRQTVGSDRAACRPDLSELPRDDPQGGDRFTGARFPAPLGEADPATRIKEVREFVLQARESSGPGAVDDLLAPRSAGCRRPS